VSELAKKKKNKLKVREIIEMLPRGLPRAELGQRDKKWRVSICLKRLERETGRETGRERRGGSLTQPVLAAQGKVCRRICVSANDTMQMWIRGGDKAEAEGGGACVRDATCEHTLCLDIKSIQRTMRVQDEHRERERGEQTEKREKGDPSTPHPIDRKKKVIV